MIKFAHIADCHINRLFIDEGIKSLTQIKNHCVKENVEFLIIAGDFWDKIVHLTEESPVNKATTIIKEIAEIIPIIIIYGNHDIRGSLEIFEKLSPNITVVSEPELLCKTNGKICKYNNSLNPDILFFCFPFLRHEYVRKKLKEEKQENTLEQADHIIESYVRYTKQKMLNQVQHLDINKIYKIAIAHGTMKGSKDAIGQDSQYLNNMDIHYIDDTFDEMDYIALGHIHSFQTLGKEFRACYPSSIYSVNFTEEDEKFCLIVELDENKTLKISPKKLDVQLVKTLKINLDELSPQRKIIMNKLKELNDMAIENQNTRWKLDFYGLKNTLEFLKDFQFAENIVVHKNYSDLLSTKEIDNSTTLTFAEKVKKYIEDNKGIKWNKSLEAKFIKINEDKIQYYNSNGDDE